MANELILIADDDPVVAGVLRTELRAHGFAVMVAVDVIQTMMAVRRTPPAALILDIMMPGGTGLEVLKRLKASGSMATIPVLAISGSPEPGLAEKTKALGADEFMRKPLNLDQLCATLNRLLGHPTPESK
jgi:CheY-like chemotaxis protein